MQAFALSCLLLLSIPAAASAQSDTAARDTVLSPLPPPDLSADARPSDLLRAAQASLAAGRLGETEESLEMAQTRMLDRSVALGQTNNPSDNPTVGQISQARQALAIRDRASCMQLIQTAIASSSAQGL